MAYVRLDWKGRVIAEGAKPATGAGADTGILMLLAIAGAIGLMLFGGKK